MLCWLLPYNNVNQPQYTYIPLLLNLPSVHLGHHRAPSWVSCVTQLLHATYFALGSIYIYIYVMCYSLNSSYLSSVHLLSRVQLFAIPWTAARQGSLSITNSQSLPKLMSIESVMPSNHPILCHCPLLLPSASGHLLLSQHQGLFKWVSSSYQVAKVLEFQLQHQSFQWTPWTDLL